VAAVVTAEHRVLAVHDQSRAASRAHRFPAACGAQQRRRKAAPVDEKQSLLMPRQAVFNRQPQFQGDAFDVARVPRRHQTHRR